MKDYAHLRRQTYGHIQHSATVIKWLYLKETAKWFVILMGRVNMHFLFDLMGKSSSGQQNLPRLDIRKDLESQTQTRIVLNLL